MEEDDGGVLEPASTSNTMDEGDFSITSDYDSIADSGSDLGSVTPSIFAHSHEHGRRYHKYKYGRYPIPNDESEEFRESIRHSMALTLLGGGLFLAPIGPNPQNIVDLGTGFGQWAIEMGDAFPSAQVTGIDLSPVQPVWVPPNVRFVIDDIEEAAWGRESSFDYVHMRVTASLLKDPVQVAATAFSKLKPGGWIEFQEILPQVHCDDGTMAPENALVELYSLIKRLLMHHSGFHLFVAEMLPQELERLGYVNVQRRVFKVPVGPWAKNRSLARAGYLLRIVLAEFVPVLAAKGEKIGMPSDMMEDFSDRLAEAMHDEQTMHTHAYVPFHFIWAQKPEATPS